MPFKTGSWLKFDEFTRTGFRDSGNEIRSMISSREGGRNSRLTNR